VCIPLLLSLAEVCLSLPLSIALSHTHTHTLTHSLSHPVPPESRRAAHRQRIVFGRWQWREWCRSNPRRLQTRKWLKRQPRVARVRRWKLRARRNRLPRRSRRGPCLLPRRKLSGGRVLQVCPNFLHLSTYRVCQLTAFASTFCDSQLTAFGRPSPAT